MGRRTKLNDDLTARLVAAISAGATLRHAASAAGIHYATLRRWMERGERTSRGQFRAFCDTVSAAIADSALWHLANIKEQARDDWRASAWILEHRFPQEYGNRAQIALEHSGSLGHWDMDSLVKWKQIIEATFPDDPGAVERLADALVAHEAQESEGTAS